MQMGSHFTAIIALGIAAVGPAQPDVLQRDVFRCNGTRSA